MTFNEAKEVIAKKYGYVSWINLVNFHKYLSDFKNFEVYVADAAELYAKTKVTESNVDLRNINIMLTEKIENYEKNRRPNCGFR